MLEKLDGRSKQVFDIVTDDKLWINNNDPESKQQLAIWIVEKRIGQQK